MHARPGNEHRPGQFADGFAGERDAVRQAARDEFIDVVIDADMLVERLDDRIPRGNAGVGSADRQAPGAHRPAKRQCELPACAAQGLARIDLDAFADAPPRLQQVAFDLVHAAPLMCQSSSAPLTHLH
jgi:hypothetical protein